jgi:DNA repair photolyase
MKTIISASRRTDIPAFYLDWFIEKIHQGYVIVKNPFYPTQKYKVSLKKTDVHSIVFWSKDFSKFLKNSSEFNDFNLFFIFTINDCKRLEPNVISLEKRLKQLEVLVAEYGPEYIEYRFDPIVYWRERGEGELMNNLNSFKTIIQHVSDLSIDNCVFSFVNWYKKCVNRSKKFGLEYYDPPLEEKLKIIKPMAQYCKNLDIRMYTCCNSDLTQIPNIYPAHCIDGNYISKLFREKCSIAKTPTREGCGCTKSKDIGNYNEQICKHACIYCYAHPLV